MTCSPFANSFLSFAARNTNIILRNSHAAINDAALLAAARRQRAACQTRSRVSLRTGHAHGPIHRLKNTRLLAGAIICGLCCSPSSDHVITPQREPQTRRINCALPQQQLPQRWQSRVTPVQYSGSTTAKSASSSLAAVCPIWVALFAAGDYRLCGVKDCQGVASFQPTRLSARWTSALRTVLWSAARLSLISATKKDGVATHCVHHKSLRCRNQWCDRNPDNVESKRFLVSTERHSSQLPTFCWPYQREGVNVYILPENGVFTRYEYVDMSNFSRASLHLSTVDRDAIQRLLAGADKGPGPHCGPPLGISPGPRLVPRSQRGRPT